MLAFEPNFIEVRHVDNGNLMQIVPGHSLRLLFADTPPSASSAALAAAAAQQHLQYHPQNPYQQQQQQYPHPGNNPYGSVSRHPMYGQQGGPSNGMVANPYSNFNPPVKLPGPRKQIIFASGEESCALLDGSLPPPTDTHCIAEAYPSFTYHRRWRAHLARIELIAVQVPFTFYWPSFVSRCLLDAARAARLFLYSLPSRQVGDCLVAVIYCYNTPHIVGHLRTSRSVSLLCSSTVPLEKQCPFIDMHLYYL